MKISIIGLLVLAMALTATAGNLDNLAPQKPITTPTPPPPPVLEVIRQGGDTIEDAVPIVVPTVDLAGTTTGYTDDYDVECPFGGHNSPDVVYSLVPEYDQVLEIDMFGSQFDTRIWVWDETLDWPIACNDDYYDDYTSRIQHVAVSGGAQYYIVIDGYQGDHGPYLIDVILSDDCDVACPTDATLEGEPPLEPDYVDLHNGGCNTDYIDPPLQEITSSVFCGVSGWFSSGNYAHYDTDWFSVQIPEGGVLQITLSAEVDTRLVQIELQECPGGDILQEVATQDCDEPTLTVAGEVGETVWLGVIPDGTTPWYIPYDAFEYDYVLVTNLGVVAVEEQSWGSLKALYR